MEIDTFHDNEILSGISILAVLRYVNCMELSKCMLVEPLLSYSRVVSALKRSNSSVKSIEDERFHERALLSMNSILLFEKLGLLKLSNDGVRFSGGNFDFFNPSLGEKAKTRIAASQKLAEILVKGDASDFYLSLRIEI